MTDEIERLLLQKRPVQILLKIGELERPYTSTIIKEVDTTFAHATNLLIEMERLGLVLSHKEGRVKYIELTEHGESVVNILKKLALTMQGGETYKKISRISSKIESIFEEDLKDKEELDRSESLRISRRLGPYQREVGKLDEIVTDCDDNLKNKVAELKERIDELIEIKSELGKSH
ncbi:MAG: hypothetical protein SVY15_01275 [Halobacteriota archaeon]|nr:hypothetical protein [Halobacteriota archaeon]